MKLDWLNTSLIIAATAILARITDIIKLIDNTFGLYSKHKRKLEVYKIDSSYLKKSSNSRFGFSIIAPITWDRFDPQNGDGNRYVHPTDENVFFSVSGIFNASEKNQGYFSETSHLQLLKQKKGFKLHSSRPSGTYYEDNVGENAVETMQIEAWRFKYMFIENKKKITATEMICIYDRTVFTIYCQAKSKDFVKYEDFFLYLISQFKILGKNSAPMARG